MPFSFAKRLGVAGFLFLACAAGTFNEQSFLEKFSFQRGIWQKQVDSLRSAGYLVHFSARAPKQKMKGTLEIYYLRPDTIVLFSPGFLGKGSLRGRWILGKNLPVFFPRENSYFEGSWEDFLLARKDETKGLDSLIFGILSHQALLVSFNNEANGPVPEKTGWIIKEDLGRWKREHIFTRRGKLSMVRWDTKSLTVEVTMDKSSKDLSLKQVNLLYKSEEEQVKFEVEEALLNVEIPLAKKNFVVPRGALRLEKIEAGEAN